MIVLPDGTVLDEAAAGFSAGAFNDGPTAVCLLVRPESRTRAYHGDFFCNIGDFTPTKYKPFACTRSCRFA